VATSAATATTAATMALSAATAGPPINTPIIFAHGQAYQIQGQYAIPLPPHEVAKLIQMGALAQVPQAPTAAPIPNGNLFRRNQNFKLQKNRSIFNFQIESIRINSNIYKITNHRI
jgi:hypothetical protein